MRRLIPAGLIAFLIYASVCTNLASWTDLKGLGTEPTPTPPQTPIIIADSGASPSADQGKAEVPSVAAIGNVRELTLQSTALKRGMKYRVVLPAGYDSQGVTRYPVIYLLHGLTGHFNDWTDRTKLAKLVEKYPFIVVTPEGENSWYTDSQLIPDHNFETYIIGELIPEVEKNFRTFADRERRLIAGLSMGGYGAVKFGLRYPDKFSMVGSFSGAYLIHKWNKAFPNSLIGGSIDKVFGPLNSTLRKRNDIFAILDAIPSEKIGALPHFYISCGTEDSPMIQTNRDFVNLLANKGKLAEYYFPRGNHDWKFWGAQIETFLQAASRRTSSGNP